MDYFEGIGELLKRQGMEFISPAEIKQKVLELAEMGYENDPSIITAKILKR